MTRRALALTKRASRLLKYLCGTPNLGQKRGTSPLRHVQQIACSSFYEVGNPAQAATVQYFSSLLELVSVGR